MQIADIDIDIYNSKIYLVSLKKEDLNSEEKYNTAINDISNVTNTPEHVIETAIDDINSCYGVTLSNDCFSIYVVILINVNLEDVIQWCHEKRHVEDRILNNCNIKDKEASAYLAGYLADKFVQILKRN